MPDVLKAQLCSAWVLGHAGFLVGLYLKHEDCSASGGLTIYDISAICGADTLR